MSEVLLIDRAQNFRKNGIGRYLLEISSRMDANPTAPGLKILHKTKAHNFREWRKAIDQNGARLEFGALKKWQRNYAFHRANPELVHFPQGNLDALWTHCAKPKIVTLHGMGQYQSQEWYEAWQIERARALRLQFDRGRGTLAHVIAVSEYVKRQACSELSLDASQITVIPNGIAHDRFFPERNRAAARTYLAQNAGIDAPFFFHLGPGGPRKNVSRTLQAFASFKTRTNSPHKFVIAGLADNAVSRKILAQAADLGVAQDVITIGQVKDDQLLRNLYRGADLFLFASLYEGFGIPVIEAMACGTPVVASNTHSLPEVCGGAAVLVDPLDTDALTAAMQQIIEQPEMGDRLREKGLAQSAQYSWDASAKAHADLYREVIDRQAA